MSPEGNLKGYRVKSFLTEIRYPACFRINSGVWTILEEFPPEDFGMLPSGGISGRNLKQSMDYVVELNRSHLLVENIEGLSQLDEWIDRVAKQLNRVINLWQIPTLTRIGVRFHLMADIETGAEKARYAKMIARGVSPLSTVADGVSDGGFAFYFKSGEWNVRFGVFSSDYDVMRKYHKFNSKESVFSQPGIVYDIDCSQINLPGYTASGSTTSKMDIKGFLKDAHLLAEGLMRKHVEQLDTSKK